MGKDATGTTTPAESAVTVFAPIGHHELEWLGLHAPKRSTRFDALEPISQGARQTFGDFDAGTAGAVQLRDDRGPQDIRHGFQARLAFLGLESYPRFLPAPQGNGIAEPFMRPPE